MKLLVVEGNNEETINKRERFGIRPYHLIFKEMLHFLEPTAKVYVVFPAHKDKRLPSTIELKEFDGVLWTGSSLSVLDDITSVTQQLVFAEDVFKSGIPFYGSCWGLQIATVVSGGEVGKSKNGLELGLTKTIRLTEDGKSSPLIRERNNNYRALCIHFDEVIKLPENATVLASNAHSKVQAMTINYKNSQFFGVQYHPEFRAQDMSIISSFLAKNNVDKDSDPDFRQAKKVSKIMNEQTDIPQEILSYRQHTQEIKTWLNFIKKRF
jgi:GMP synthase (glutamine-hydrolysing)